MKEEIKRLKAERDKLIRTYNQLFEECKRYKAERDMYLRERDSAMDSQREAEERADNLQQQLSEAREENDAEKQDLFVRLGRANAELTRLREGLERAREQIEHSMNQLSETENGWSYDVLTEALDEIDDILNTPPPDTQEHDTPGHWEDGGKTWEPDKSQNVLQEAVRAGYIAGENNAVKASGENIDNAVEQIVADFAKPDPCPGSRVTLELVEQDTCQTCDGGGLASCGECQCPTCGGTGKGKE